MRGLYVHIPFCASKCAYCDFYSLPNRKEDISYYIDAFLKEAQHYQPITGSTGVSACTSSIIARSVATKQSVVHPPHFQTLYLGGGTPSLLGADNLKQLISGLAQIFDFSDLIEATFEVNPESATEEFLAAASQILGQCNKEVQNSSTSRLSIGIQSLSDYELKSVGRIHNAAQAIKAIETAKKLHFTSISCDVIVGLPGQNRQSLSKTLEILTQLGIQHLSIYCLSLEHDTPLALNPPDDLPSDDMQAELFEQATAYLEKQGFVHYEISNFSLEGHECRHNLNYWRGGEYLGLGPAAASHLNGKRFKNKADLDAYLNDPTGQIEEVEMLDAKAKAAEEAMLRLRLLQEGLNINELASKFGEENIRELKIRLNKLAVNGSLVSDASIYKLSPDRVLTSNPIFGEVVG